MRPQDTAYIIERLAVRFVAMVADHERQLAEHRASFGARTEADAKIIAGLRAERDRLQTQVQDMRAEMEQLQMEVAALKSQTPKHPVKVGEWVKRTDCQYDGVPIGTIKQVALVRKNESYELTDGEFWSFMYCQPCDPPEATHDTPEGRSVVESVIRNDRNTEPRPGDTVRLVRIPSRSDVSPKLQTTLEWPWIERWGTLNQTALVVEPAYQLAGAVSVCLSANVHARWPICCVEVVRTEPDDIKVGDLVEVVSNRGRNTWLADVGSLGTVTSVEEINESISVCLDDVPGKQNALAGYVSLCDVRKVTT